MLEEEADHETGRSAKNSYLVVESVRQAPETSNQRRCFQFVFKYFKRRSLRRILKQDIRMYARSSRCKNQSEDFQQRLKYSRTILKNANEVRSTKVFKVQNRLFSL